MTRIRKIHNKKTNSLTPKPQTRGQQFFGVFIFILLASIVFFILKKEKSPSSTLKPAKPITLPVTKKGGEESNQYTWITWLLIILGSMSVVGIIYLVFIFFRNWQVQRAIEDFMRKNKEEVVEEDEEDKFDTLLEQIERDYKEDREAILNRKWST